MQTRIDSVRESEAEADFAKSKNLVFSRQKVGRRSSGTECTDPCHRRGADKGRLRKDPHCRDPSLADKLNFLPADRSRLRKLGRSALRRGPDRRSNAHHDLVLVAPSSRYPSDRCSRRSKEVANSDPLRKSWSLHRIGSRGSKEVPTDSDSRDLEWIRLGNRNFLLQLVAVDESIRRNLVGAPELNAPGDTHIGSDPTADPLDRVQDLKLVRLLRTPCSCCVAIESRIDPAVGRRKKPDLDSKHQLLVRDSDRSSRRVLRFGEER